MSKKQRNNQSKGTTMSSEDQTPQTPPNDQITEAEKTPVEEGTEAGKPPVGEAKEENPEKAYKGVNDETTPEDGTGTDAGASTPAPDVATSAPAAEGAEQPPVVVPDPEPKVVEEPKVVDQGTKDSSVPAPVPDVVVIPTPEPEPVKAPDGLDSTVTPKIVGEMEAVLATATIATGTRLALSAIQQYEIDMKAGKPIAAAMGAAHQRGLFMALKAVINKSSHAEFPIVFRALLKTLEANRTGCFKPQSVFRFLTEGNFNSEDISTFRQAISMMIALAPVKSREIIKKQTDIRKALNGFEPVAIERVIEFFA